MVSLEAFVSSASMVPWGTHNDSVCRPTSSHDCASLLSLEHQVFWNFRHLTTYIYNELTRWFNQLSLGYTFYCGQKLSVIRRHCRGTRSDRLSWPALSQWLAHVMQLIRPLGHKAAKPLSHKAALCNNPWTLEQPACDRIMWSKFKWTSVSEYPGKRNRLLVAPCAIMDVCWLLIIVASFQFFTLLYYRYGWLGMPFSQEHPSCCTLWLLLWL